jgi:hypothetical protein
VTIPRAAEVRGRQLPGHQSPSLDAGFPAPAKYTHKQESTLEPQQDYVGSARLRELAAELNLLQAARLIAWDNVIEAYKVALSGTANAASLDPAAALDVYRAARAKQAAAERAMLTYLVEASQASKAE